MGSAATWPSRRTKASSAERRRPSAPRVLNQRADVFRSLGKTDQAASDWQRSLQLAPKQIDGYLGLARVLEQQGKAQLAQDQYERAKSQLQIQVLQFLRDTGTLRLDPQGGSLAMAMDRAALKVANKTASPR